MVVGSRLQGTPETEEVTKYHLKLVVITYLLYASCITIKCPIIHIKSYYYVYMYAWTDSLPGHWNDGLLISIGEHILKRLYFRLWMIIIHPDDDDPNWLVYCEWVESTNEWLTSVCIYTYMYTYKVMAEFVSAVDLNLNKKQQKLGRVYMDVYGKYKSV